jgi:hypothetical protein
MAIPTDSNYPATLDDDDSLMGDLTNQVELTLDGAINDSVTSFTVNESITDINVPCVFIFDDGEIVFCGAKDDGTKTFSSCVRGALGGGSAASHSDTDTLVMDVVNVYLYMLKKAIIKIETELGTDPAGTETNVSDRLDLLALKTLGNLASVALNTSIIPASDGSVNLGSTSKRFKEIFSRYLLLDHQATSSGDRPSGVSELYVDDYHTLMMETSIGETEVSPKSFMVPLDNYITLTNYMPPYYVIQQIGSNPNYMNIPTLAYDDTNIEGRGFPFIMPTDFKGLKLYVDIYYYMDSSNTSKACKWQPYFVAIQEGDDVPNKNRPSTPDTAAISCPDTAGELDIATVEVDIGGGEHDNLAAGDTAYLILSRNGNHPDDTASGDAIVTGIKVRYK